MISIKSDREIELMRRAGALTSQARALAGSMVKPGVSTLEIDHAVRDFIRAHGAEPSFLNYSGYPGSACISINEQVIHGIPGPRKLKEGDIVYAVVADIRNTMATADVVAKDGSQRTLGGETYATIHVSKISQKYTDDVSKELRKGDMIRARVTGVKPSLQLTTKDDHLGCIRALCSKCKTEMVRKGTGLFCPECKYSMPRKLADDYGDVKL